MPENGPNEVRVNVTILFENGKQNLFQNPSFRLSASTWKPAGSLKIEGIECEGSFVFWTLEKRKSVAHFRFSILKDSFENKIRMYFNFPSA